MANICSFSAKIVGGKKKQTKKAYDIIANKQKNIICGRGFYTLSEEPEIKEEEKKLSIKKRRRRRLRDRDIRRKVGVGRVHSYWGAKL